MSGRNRVPMADLRRLVGELGGQEVQALLQSGNVVFGGDISETSLESALETQLGVKVAVLIRTAAEWDQLVANLPFPGEAASDPSHLVAMPLKASTLGIEDLRAAICGPEQVEVRGDCLYATYPAGIGDSKLTISVIERKLVTVGTARNWNTVLKINALLGT